MNMRGATAIVGMGDTGFIGNSANTPISLASRVVATALEDSGLRRSDIDGLVVHIGSPRGSDYDRTASALGLSVRFAAQPWSHGRFASTAILHAAMALSAGLADCILVVAAYNNSAFGRHGVKERPGFQESLRAGGGPHAETPHTGLTAPVAGTAMAAQRYYHKYNVDPEKLATIALSFRDYARMNAGAAMRKPLTREEYLSSRYIVEPLRLFDCSVIVDGAVAVIMTRADRARDTKGKPVYLLGAQGLHAGPNEFIFGQPGLGIDQADVFDYRPQGADQLVYKMAGVTPADIDLMQVYDAFSPLVLWTLERFGYCPVGQAADWIQNGRIGPGGDLPLNTSGGFLSEGHFNGWGQMAEIVRQLRGVAGTRQVPDAQLAHWASAIGDSLIFGSDSKGGR